MIAPTLFLVSLLSVETGARVLHDTAPTIGATITCVDCGPSGTNYELGFDLMEGYKDSNGILQLRGQIVKPLGPVDLGLGFYYLNHEIPIVCDFGFHLLGRFRFTDRVSLQWRHSSYSRYLLS